MRYGEAEPRSNNLVGSSQKREGIYDNTIRHFMHSGGIEENWSASNRPVHIIVKALLTMHGHEAVYIHIMCVCNSSV